MMKSDRPQAKRAKRFDSPLGRGRRTKPVVPCPTLPYEKWFHLIQYDLMPASSQENNSSSFPATVSSMPCNNLLKWCLPAWKRLTPARIHLPLSSVTTIVDHPMGGRRGMGLLTIVYHSISFGVKSASIFPNHDRAEVLTVAPDYWNGTLPCTKVYKSHPLQWIPLLNPVQSRTILINLLNILRIYLESCRIKLRGLFE